MLANVHGQPEGVAYLQRVVEGAFTLPLLLCGEQGTGRRFSVLEAAKALFEPSQHYALDHGAHPDFRVLEGEDGKDIKVDSVRDALDAAHALPAWAPLKFFVVDGADRLTDAAANALLKTLEEPPSKARFFLLAERIERVIPTIRSRCAVVSYRRLSERFILSKLVQITEDETKALVACRIAEGSLGNAVRCLVSGQLTLRDEVVAILSLTTRKDLFAVFSAVNDLGDNLSLGLRFLSQLLRDLLLVVRTPERVLNVDIVDALRRLREQLGEAKILGLLAELRELRKRAESPINVAFHVKAALASACV